MKQTPGKIFLADQRGFTETAQFRRYSTFNFEDYKQANKEPFGNLYGFNEELLAGSQSLNFAVDQATHVILIPVTGGINFVHADGNNTVVEVEDILINTLPANTSFQIVNPYEKEVITFLQIWIKAEQAINTNSFHLFNFNLSQNQLTGIVARDKAASTAVKLPFSISIGRFDGREEVIYTLKSKDSGFFAFVIAGAFEIEGRLMHEKDGLALWDTEEVELEALSNNALVLVTEIKNIAPQKLQ